MRLKLKEKMELAKILMSDLGGKPLTATQVQEKAMAAGIQVDNANIHYLAVSSALRA